MSPLRALVPRPKTLAPLAIGRAGVVGATSKCSRRYGICQ